MPRKPYPPLRLNPNNPNLGVVKLVPPPVGGAFTAPGNEPPPDDTFKADEAPPDDAFKADEPPADSDFSTSPVTPAPPANMPSEQAQKVLQIAQHTDAGPEHVAGLYDDYAAAVQDSLPHPAVEKYASQGPVQAAAVKGDPGLPLLAKQFVGPFDGPAVKLSESGLETIMQARPMRALYAGLIGVGTGVLKTEQAIYKLVAGHESATLKRSIAQGEVQQQTAYPPAAGAPEDQPLLPQVIDKTMGALPMIASMMSGHEAAGKVGTGLVLGLLGTGELESELAKSTIVQTKPDGSHESIPRYTPRQAASLAILGGSVNAVAGAYLGDRLVRTLVPKGWQLQGQAAIVSTLETMLRDGSLSDRLVGAGIGLTRNAVSAAMFMAAQNAINNLTEQFGAKLTSGEPFDLSAMTLAAGKGAADSLKILPLAMIDPVMGFFRGNGARLIARQDMLRLAIKLQAAKDSPFVRNLPQDAKPVIHDMAADGPETHVFIHPDVFGKVASEAGHDPAALAHQMTGDANAWKDGQDNGTPLRVPVENVLVDLNLLGLADKMLPGMLHDGNGGSLHELDHMQREPMVEQFDPNAITTETRALTPEEVAAHNPNPEPLEINGSKAMRTYAEHTLASRPVGALSSRLYTQNANTAQRAVDDMMSRAVAHLGSAAMKAQTGIEAGVSAAETAGVAAEKGRKSALYNMGFARTARLIEWLKGLNTARSTAALPTTAPYYADAPTSAETGLYDTPLTESTKPPDKVISEMGAARDLAEHQRTQAMRQFKASKAAQGKAETLQQRAEDKSVSATESEVKSGDLLTQASQQEFVRDMNAALAKEAKRIETAHNKIKAFFGRSSDIIGVPGKVEYAQGQDAILRALGLRQGDGVFDFGATVERMLSDLLPVKFDVDGIQDLMRNPRSLDDMTLKEAENVRDAMQQIRKAARESNRVTFAEQMQTIEEARAELADTYRNKPPEARRLPGGDGALDESVVATLFKGFRAELSSLPLLFRKLGTLGDRLRDGFIAARNANAESADRVLGRFHRDFGGKGPSNATDLISDTLGSTNPKLADKWFRGDMWVLAAWMGSRSGRDGAVDGLFPGTRGEARGLSETKIWRFLDKNMSQAEWSFVNALHRFHEEDIWPRVAEQQAKNTGMPLEKVDAAPYETAHGKYDGGYFLRAWQGGTIRSRPGSIADFTGDLQYLNNSMYRRHLNERMQYVEGVPDFSWNRYSQHLSAVLHSVDFNDYVRDFGRLLTNPGFIDTAESTLGVKDTKALIDALHVIGRGKVEDPVRGAFNLNKFIGSVVRGRVAGAAFGGNTRVALGQLSHLPFAAFFKRYDPEIMMAGLARTLDMDTWDEAHALSTQLPYRLQNSSARMREMLDGVGSGEVQGWKSNTDSVAHAPFMVMDAFLSRAIFEMGRIKAERDGLSPADAIKRADRDVFETMPAKNIMEQSAFARDRGALGAIFLVKQFPNVIFNNVMIEKWQHDMNVWNSEPGWQRFRAKWGGAAASTAFGLGAILSVHVGGRYMMGHGKREDQTHADWLLQESVAAPFYMLPGLSEAAEAGTKVAFSDKPAMQALRGVDVRAAPYVSFVTGLIHDAASIVAHGSAPEDKFIAATDGFMKAMGIPFSAPLPQLRSALKQGLGRSQYSTPLGRLSGVTFGEPHSARTPLTDFTGGQ